MITDHLNNLSRYRGLHPALDTAIDWLANHDLAALPLGCTEIDGRRVYVNLEGSESWGWASDAQGDKPFDEQADCGFAAGPEHCSSLLGEGRFALFLPGEYHKPSCISSRSSSVRKAVVKIRMGE